MATFTLVSCSTNTSTIKDITTTATQGNVELKGAPLSSMQNFDTLTITEKCAVFYSPDSAQIEKEKKLAGEEDFYTIADDAVNYSSDAHVFLDSVNLKTVDIDTQKVIRFISADKTQKLIKLSKRTDLWGIYFFDPKKKPRWVDMTDIEEEYKNYFK
jgi:hypothetical protein